MSVNAKQVIKKVGIDMNNPKPKNKLVMYGATWCPDCHRSRKYLDDHHIAYDWINIEESVKAAELVSKLNNSMKIIPTIVFPDGSILTEPSNMELEEKLVSSRLNR